MNTNTPDQSGCLSCPDFGFCTNDQPQELNEELVRALSAYKYEPAWMLELRLKALTLFQKLPLPKWGPDLSEINFAEICYFLAPQNGVNPKKLNEKYFAGLNAQMESELVYQNLQKEWEEQGVIFCDMHTAVERYPNLIKQYFNSIIQSGEHKFTALNTAVWSGGNFIYIPPNVHLSMPLQAFFQISSPHFGQFERSIIIVDEGASLHYLEGCAASKSLSSSLHAGTVEIFVKDNASLKYTTFQRWSDQIINLVTKRALLGKNSQIEWVDGNFGSKTTMKYPGVIFGGDNAKAEIYSLSVAGKNQNQDFGNNLWYKASNCSVIVESKSIAKDGGTATTRTTVKTLPKLKNNKGKFSCNALLINQPSIVKTIPKLNLTGENCQLIHEAKVGKVDQEKILYLQSKGISPKKAETILISGFFESISSRLPSEYAIEIEQFLN